VFEAPSLTVDVFPNPVNDVEVEPNDIVVVPIVTLLFDSKSFITIPVLPVVIIVPDEEGKLRTCPFDVEMDAAFIVPVDVIDLTERFPVNTILSAYTLPLMPAPPDNNKAPVTLLVLAVVFVDTNWLVILSLLNGITIFQYKFFAL